MVTDNGHYEMAVMNYKHTGVSCLPRVKASYSVFQMSLKKIVSILFPHLLEFSNMKKPGYAKVKYDINLLDRTLVQTKRRRDVIGNR